jgi:threonylcarbamoyladenosine tRNA methylthiotransferase MtaB
MKTFSITTLGCKVNQYETQQIREFLEQSGLRQISTAEKPDLAIINSCCVTHIASAKTRQYIHKTRKLAPDSIIVVAGCLPAVQTGELNNVKKDVYLIKNRDNLALTLTQIINNNNSLSAKQGDIIKSENPSESKNKLTNSPKLPQLTIFRGHTRAFLKVQDGCDGWCSYCIVPKVRPNVQSKPIEMILLEAQALVKAGHKEIVVTGIFLGAFGQPTVRRKNWPNQQNDNLAELLNRLAQIPNLARIRVSSLEPADITGRLLDVFCKHPNIMPHLHLSLQSGSDAILKKMCRQYTADDFMEKIALIKAQLDRPAITGDIIVGFPGETDGDFEATVSLAREVGFAKIHVFSFSPRKGTAAAGLNNKVDKRLIKNRSKILLQLDKELGYKFRQQFIGETATILTENANGKTYGRSERYFVVYIKNAQKPVGKNELIKVKLTENTETATIGILV